MIDHIANITENLLLYGLMFGLVWINAWIWNPDITSNTVNFIAATVAIIVVFCNNKEA